MSASQLLAGSPAAVVTPINVQSIVADVDGAFTIQNENAGAGATVQIECLGQAGINIQAVGGGNISFDAPNGFVDMLATQAQVGRTDAVGDANLLLQTQNVATDVIAFSLTVGGTAVPNAAPQNKLSLYSYVNGAFGDRFFTTGNAGAATPGHGTLNFTPAQCGTAVVAVGQSSIAVPLDIITANSIVLASISGNAAVDATATAVSNIVINAGVGFTVQLNANATVARTVHWWMPRYDNP
jgi:hypothetical protein